MRLNFVFTNFISSLVTFKYNVFSPFLCFWYTLRSIEKDCWMLNGNTGKTERKGIFNFRHRKMQWAF